VASTALQFSDPYGTFPTPSYVPTRVSFGVGALSALDLVLAGVAGGHKARCILLITGTRSPAKPWQEQVRDSVAAYRHIAAENRTSNPTIESITPILTRARAAGVELVVGIGGGSVLDTAKTIAALVRSEMTLRDALAEKPAVDPVPFIAIPTTAGTGSEVTPFATVWDDAAKLKYSISGAKLYPAAAIVDPALTTSMPRAVAAGTGLDALTHAMEACWSVNANEESIREGLAAIALLANHLAASVHNPADIRRRALVSQASLHAGFAIARAQTTIAHAISYPLTVRYGVHHGHAVSLSVGPLARFNAAMTDADCQDPRGIAHVCDVLARVFDALGVPDGVAAEQRVLALVRSLGLKLFGDFREFDLETIASDVIAYDRFRNNPRAMSHAQLRDFLTRLRRGPLH
jgi:alcohol dehydrogenase class IV